MEKAYKRLRMSEQRKREILREIKNGRPIQRKSYVAIVMPLFVAIAGLFLFISVGGDSKVSEVTTGAGFEWEAITHEAMFQELLILWIVSLIFLMMAYVQYLLLARNPKWLVQFRLIQWGHEAFGSWRKVLIFALPFVWIAVETVVLIVTTSTIVMQFFVVVLLLLNVMLVQLGIVKNRERAKCPHCGVELTNKEIVWNKNCGICGNGRLRKVQHSAQEFFATFGGFFVMFFPFFQVSLVYILLYIPIYFYFTMKYILPHLYVFQKEDEIPPPLW